MINKKSILIVLSLFTIHFVKSQNNNIPSTLSLIPPSPEVAQLNKYIDMPVNYYTGVPQINYPIYAIKVGGVNLPIGLNYHAGGHKVDDVSSCVGLGWSLNAGGQISRTLAGLPDEWGDGYLNLPPTPTTRIIESSDNGQVIQDYALGSEDSEPDYFYLNVNGANSKFVFDKTTRQPNFFPWVNVKLESPFQTANSNSNLWKMTSSDGTIYFFNEIEQINSYAVNQRGNTMLYTSSWALSKILLPNKRDSIVFEYIQNDYDYFTNFSETEYFKIAGNENKPNVTSYNRSISQARVVSKIKFPTGEVEFIYSDNSSLNELKRCDMPSAKYLKSVIVKNLKNKRIKEFNFYYSHFNSISGSTPLQTSCTSLNKNELRLRLDSVAEINTALRLTTKFQYNVSENLPNRIESKSLDHWGYYNGANNANRIPITRLYHQQQPEYELVHLNTGLADKKSNFTYTKANILEKIIYPTGGNTYYEYEQNDCASNILDDNFQIAQNHTVIKQNVNATFNGASILLLRNYTEVEITPINVPENSRLQIKIYDGYQNLISTRIYNNYPNTQVDPLDPYFVTIPNQNFAVESSMTGIGANNLQSTDNVFNIKWFNEINKKKKPVGGLRVKSIKSYDGISNSPVLIKDFEYSDNIDPTYSSGKILGVPNYIYATAVGGGPNTPQTRYYNITSSPSNSAGYMQGSLVSYGRVLVKVKDAVNNFNGASEYFFNTPDNYPDIYNVNTYNLSNNTFSFPFIGPEMQNEWRRGELLKSIEYKSSNNQLVKVSEKQNTYKYYSGNPTPFSDNFSSKGKVIQAGKAFVLNPQFAMLYNGPVSLYEFYPYSIRTGSFGFLEETKEVTYNENGIDKLETITKNSINDDLLVVETEVKDSKNQIKKSTVKYPKEIVLSNNDPTGTYQAMVNRNMIAIPIEQSTKNISLNQELSKSLTNYTGWFGNAFFAPSSIQSSIQGSLLKTDLTITKVDDRGSILEGKGKSGINVVYLYGYNAQYPVAQVIGATHATVSALVSQTVLNNPLTTDAAMRAELNNLRTGLAGTKAQVTTMTYEPLIGMTSQTNPNGKTNFYEYDGFNRLTLIRNQDGNIVKKFCYKYDGQQEDCGLFYSILLSQGFTRNNCPSGQTGGAVTFTVPAGMFSSTVSQADADQQALNYLNANGQTYANNNGSCTAVSSCNYSNCMYQGEAYACINGTCEMGIQVITGSYFDMFSGTYMCVYHYEYSDGSWSQDYTISTGGAQCFITW